MTKNTDANENLTTLKFHFYSLKFTPYKDLNKHNSSSILNKVITYVSEELQKGQGYLIDRHHKRIKGDSRELFMTQAVFMLKERRIRCSMALLRSGRIPLLKPADKFVLVPLNKAEGSIAEQTHFFIDYSKTPAVICVEYNYHGPRISDIEYYFRNVSHDILKLSKVTDVALFMDTSIDKTLSELKNVLNIDIKVQPQKLIQMDTDLVGRYFTAFTTMGQRLKPKYIKLEAMYQTPGSSVASSQLNSDANNMIINLLNRFKTKPLNIDCFDNFVVKYEDKEGQEEVFNLLKDKREVLKEVDLSSIQKGRHYYELIEKDFDEFMETI
ncbi:MAG TPA: hypothetical protein VL125_04835 [Pelobium sp.]|nr:hypothetical protein [Pelobium sp.]